MEILGRLFSYSPSKHDFLWVSFTLFTLFFGATPAVSGPFYYGSGGFERYDRVYMNNPHIINWAIGVDNYNAGSDVEGKYGNQENALGKASGNAFDIVSLGRGGSITLTFEYPIKNGKEWDFAVFENAFDKFLELAYVEVSSDGNSFVRFNNCSLTSSPVSTYGTIDFTNITGLAGKYKKGYGTPFDLLDLVKKPEVYSGKVNLNRISYVRIIDIIGDKNNLDDRTDAMKTRWGDNFPIFDPYPTYDSAGFDLDAVGVRYQNTSPNNDPNRPILLSPKDDEEARISLAPTFKTEPFYDQDKDDLHIQTRWQISKDKDFSDPNLLLDVTSFIYLTSLALDVPILDEESKYYWRAKFYDASLEESTWSEEFLFITTDLYIIDSNSNGIPDDQEFKNGGSIDPNKGTNIMDHNMDTITDLNKDGIPDINQMNDQFKCLNTIVGKGKSGIETDGEVEVLFFKSIDPNSITDPNQIEYKLAKPDNLPLGLLGFRLKTELGDDPNIIITITIYFSEPMPGEAKWYNYDLRDGWSCYSEKTVNRDYLILKLQDGGSGDIDDVQNGYIITIGGMGYFDKEIPPPDQEAGFGGMGSCFIISCL